MSPILYAKLSAMRRKRTAFAAGRGIAAMAGALVLLLGAEMFLDWLLELPRWIRAALLAIDIAVLSYILVRYVVWPIVFGPDYEELALSVERAMPQFQTRLIASVQLGRPEAVPAGASRSLVRAMVAQTERLAEPLDFNSIVRPDALLRTAGLSALIILLGALAYVAAGRFSFDLLRRALLSNVPVPRNTQVVCLSGDRVMPIGDPVTLDARAEGVVPSAGKVELSYVSGRNRTFSIDAVPQESGRFARTVENVQESFSYRIRLGDGHSRWYRIDAVPRPTIAGVQFRQQYPAYTQRPPEERLPGNLSLLAGSELHVKIKASKPVGSARAQLVGLEQDLALTPSAADPTEITGIVRIPPRGLTGLSFRLLDRQGIASRSDTVYPIDVVPDREPMVRITWPDRREELATQQARVLLGFEATDDFAVAKVVVRHKLESQADEAAKSIELDLADQPDRRLIRRRYELNLGSISPLVPEGGTVEYWVEVQDANDVTGPGKGSSDRYKVKVVSALEKLNDLMNRGNDLLSTLDNVTQDQERLNQNLGKLILEKQ